MLVHLKISKDTNKNLPFKIGNYSGNSEIQISLKAHTPIHVNDGTNDVDC